MERRQFGVAVVGSGRIGTLCATLAAAHPAVRFLAVSDRKPERVRKLAEKVGAQAWSANNLEAMSRPEVDAVIVSTIEVEHSEPVLQALELRKPVLVEKPIALATPKDARRALEISVANNARCKLAKWSNSRSRIIESCINSGAGRRGPTTGATATLAIEPATDKVALETGVALATPQAALSGSHTKASGYAGGYLREYRSR
ncbi:MAG: hypothetical protein A3G24_06340 [Betaproteobacteria bacterium RIFCSPLOWO2_12_FULL_62_13]|nr:MAG: hypothetical protein A3G24_06340 [Betaproteobacteria bacterium RIFCSPLOWO2_12_FULL_62_13]